MAADHRVSKRRVFTYTSIECCLLLAYRSRKDSLAIERCGVVCHGHPVPVGIAPHTLDLERHSASHYAEYITALKRRACPIKCRDVVFLRSASHHESFHGSFSIQRLRARCLLVRRMRFYGYVRASTGCSNVTLLRRKRFNNDNLRGGGGCKNARKFEFALSSVEVQDVSKFCTFLNGKECGGWSFEIVGKFS